MGRRSHWWRGLLFSILLVGLAGPSSAFTTKTITIDGNVGDWSDVLVDPDNTQADAAVFSDPPDPDLPGTADRDIRAFAVTWDDSRIYFFLRRTLSGNNSFTFVVYIDADHSGTLEASDYIATWDYNGSSYQAGNLYRYVPAAPGGDPITGDGVDQPGSRGALVAGTSLTGGNSPDGIEFETSLRWVDMGLAPGTCLWFHGSVSTGTNLPGQVQDNTDPIDGKIVELDLEADQIGSTSTPGTVRYSHTVCHEGNCTDTLDLSLRSDRGWGVRVFSDPDGDGDPSDGALLGEDLNGDGDFSDDTDTLAPGADTNGNELLDTGLLGEGECVSYVVELIVPRRQPQDRVDRLRVRARSAYRPSVTADNFDRTQVGAVVIHPDRTGSGLAGSTVNLAHLACNHQASADTLTLEASDAQGWPLEIWSDPNGDGDPSDGAPLTDTGSLAPGACRPVVLRVTIPPGTAAGAEDAVEVTATSSADPDVVSRVADTVRVAAVRFEVTPDHTANAGPSDTLYFSHTLTNHGSFPDAFTLSGTSSLGSTLTFLTDPDGDGLPNDSQPIPPGTPLGPIDPFGGERLFLLKVDTPAGVSFPNVDTVVVTARSEADSTAATATDTVSLQRLLTYSDPLFARPTQEWFSTCATIHAQGYNMQTNNTYRFVWTDPTGRIARTGPEIKPDNKGRVDDSFTLGCADPPGDWTVKVQIKSGSRWLDEPDALAPFRILDPAIGEAGDITRLRTSREVYNFENDSVVVSSTLHNDTPADYLGTLVRYVVFLDQDGDGAPTAGEPYILPDGSRGTWADGDATHVTTGIDILSGKSFDDLWRVDDVDFQDQTQWCLWAEWSTDCDCGPIRIDTALTCFEVSCFPVPLIDAGLEKDACPGEAVALDDATSDGDIFEWDDAGAGGAFTPSDAVLNPFYANDAVGSHELTLTALFSSNGCLSRDAVLFNVYPRPTLDAGEPKEACVGEPVVLDDAAQSGGDDFAWDDGGAGGSFSPSAADLNPSYTHPAPGTYTLSLAVTDTTTPAVCSDTDTTTVSVTAHPTVEAGADKATCTSMPVALDDATLSGGDAVLWEDLGAGGTFSPSPTVLNPDYQNSSLGVHTLSLTVTDTTTSALCDTTDTLSVEVLTDPQADAGSDQTLTCNTTSVTLAGSGTGGSGSYGYAWQPADQVSDPSSPTPTTSVTGTYTLTVTDLVTGCIATDTVVVDQSNQRPVANAGPDKEITCIVQEVTLEGAASGGNGGQGYTFRWEPATQVSNPDVDRPTTASPGIYTLTVTDNQTGCTATDTVTVADNTEPPVAEAGPDKTVTCREPSVTLEGAASGGDGSEGYGYSWEPAAQVSDPSLPQPATDTAGVYTLTVTDVHTGCTATDSMTVVEDDEPPLVEAGPDKEITCEQRVLVLEGAATGGSGDYTWSWEPAAQVSDPTIPQPTTDVSGTYQLTVVDEGNGCFASDTVLVSGPNIIPPVEPSPVDLDPSVTPLRVEKASGGRLPFLRLSWEDTGFAANLYRGSLSSLHQGVYDHGSIGVCALDASSEVVASARGGNYYLVVTRECFNGEESSYGRATFGERPDAAAASGDACP